LHGGSTALVHGGSGGVGTAAIQLGRAAKARVLVTAGSDERCRRCLELGADAAFNYRREDFAARTLEVTGGAGVDVVMDCIGASYLDRHLEVLAPEGRLVVIGLMGGAQAPLDLARLLRRRLSIIGSTLRSRSPGEKGRIIRSLEEGFGREVSEGSVRPIVDRVLPLGQAAEAHRLLEAGDIFGKVVLSVEEPGSMTSL
jgi:NADPH:quinone reductase-like Zn-dependent oxidoreductase